VAVSPGQTALTRTPVPPVARPDFRGCPFHNASTEYEDPGHPARRIARDHRDGLRQRLGALGGEALGDRLAVLVDGAYTSAAHLGPAGPAAAGLALAHRLVDDALDA
jgi:hypothetical protein